MSYHQILRLDGNLAERCDGNLPFASRLMVSGARWPRRWITSSACIGWASSIDGFPRRMPNVVGSLMPKSFHDSRIGPWDDRSAVVVGAKQQHGQEQVVVGVVEREQRRPC